MLEHELTEFGRRMGMAEFALNENGLAALMVEGLGTLYLEKTGERNDAELLVYVAVPMEEHDVEMPAKVLALCDYRRAHIMPLTGGVHNGQVVLLTRHREEQVSAALLENSVLFLAQKLDQLEH